MNANIAKNNSTRKFVGLQQLALEIEKHGKGS